MVRDDRSTARERLRKYFFLCQASNSGLVREVPITRAVSKDSLLLYLIIIPTISVRRLEITMDLPLNEQIYLLKR